MPMSGQVAQRWMLLRMLRLPLVAGGQNCRVMSMDLGLRTGSSRPHGTQCCDTEDLRAIAHWNVPLLGFCGMRVGSYKSEVTNEEVFRFSAETHIRLMNHLS